MTDIVSVNTLLINVTGQDDDKKYGRYLLSLVIHTRMIYLDFCRSERMDVQGVMTYPIVVHKCLRGCISQITLLLSPLMTSALL